MRRFLGSKFFIVVVLIAIVLTVVPTVLSAMGLRSVVKDAALSLLSPIQHLCTYATDAVEGFTSYFTEFDRVVEENNALREKILELENQIDSALETEQMNEWLYDYLELKREHADFQLESANVTGRESGNYMTVFTLDKGTAHGVEKNMPIISKNAIVGYITEAGSNWSKAVTILESGQAIGAYVERSGAVGVVEGDFSLASQGLCKLSYLGADADVEVGDRILSSGYGSVYPRSLVIGHVTEIEKDPYSQSITVYIQPAASLSDEDRFMIITEYDTYTE
mgnify:FL=1